MDVAFSPKVNLNLILVCTHIPASFYNRSETREKLGARIWKRKSTRNRLYLTFWAPWATRPKICIFRFFRQSSVSNIQNILIKEPCIFLNSSVNLRYECVSNPVSAKNAPTKRMEHSKGARKSRARNHQSYRRSSKKLVYFFFLFIYWYIKFKQAKN